jgi:hypothetical protein
VFQPAALAMALETAGPDDGVGVTAFAYDSRGQWQSVDLADPDPGMDALEHWVALTYPLVGPWAECLFHIVWSDNAPNAHIEFEFEDDKNRWVFDAEGQAPSPDRMRPQGLPIPLKPGPHF